MEKNKIYVNSEFGSFEFWFFQKLIGEISIFCDCEVLLINKFLN